MTVIQQQHAIDCHLSGSASVVEVLLSFLLEDMNIINAVKNRKPNNNTIYTENAPTISVCGSCSSFMLWCSSCRARPSGHLLICLGLVHIVALQSSVLLYYWQYSNLHNLYLYSGSFESS